MLNFDTALIGASFYAAGYAAAAKKNCIVIERRTVVGSEFAACLNADPIKKACGIAGEFSERLKKCGIACENGRIHAVPCAMKLARFILENEINILLETETLSIEKDGEGFAIKIFNRDGMQTLKAKNVINTEGFYTEGANRTLGAMLVGGKASLNIPERIGFITYERYDHEPIFHLHLSEKDNMVSAREKMRDLIENTKYLADWQIGAVASEIAWHYKGAVRAKNANGVLAIPSASFGDMISAMEGGAADALSNN